MLMRRQLIVIYLVTLAVPLSAAIAAAAAPPFQEEDVVIELLRNYGLATVLILIAIVFFIRYWWPHHVKKEEQQQVRADKESENRIEQEAAQTNALQEISLALQNVQTLQAQEAVNVAAISQALQESAISTKASADVLAAQLKYQQELHRYILDSNRRDSSHKEEKEK